MQSFSELHLTSPLNCLIHNFSLHTSHLLLKKCWSIKARNKGKTKPNTNHYYCYLNFFLTNNSTSVWYLLQCLYGIYHTLVHCESLHPRVLYCGSGIGSNEQGEYCRAVLKWFCRIAKNRDINHLPVLYFYFYHAELQDYRTTMVR